MCVGWAPYRVVDVVEAVPVKSVLGKEYRKESKAIIVYLSELNESAVLNLEKDLQEKGLSIIYTSSTVEPLYCGHHCEDFLFLVFLAGHTM